MKIGARLKWFLFYFVLFMLFAGTVDWQNALAASISACSGILLLSGIRRSARLDYKTSLPWFRNLALKLPFKVVSECWLILACAWGQIFGKQVNRGGYSQMQTGPIEGNALSNARQAFLIAAVSLAPNTYITKVDSKAGTATIHQLIKRSETGPQQWLR